MKAVYIAAAYHRQEEMKKLSLRIKRLGIHVTSNWLDETPLPEDPVELKRELTERAQMDTNDIRLADTLIRFSDDLSTPTVPSKWCTASRMEESGMAHAWKKRVIVVGGHQSIFDYLPKRIHLKDVHDLLKYIKEEK